MQLRLFAAVTALSICSSCVSVNLPNSGSTKASGLNFSEPSSPFSKIKSEQVDYAWQSQKTGNTIAVITDCSAHSDTPLKSLENETLAALSDIKILSTEPGMFNGRESLMTSAEGKVDGVPVEISVLTFKKNACNYTLNYLGKKASFESEEKEFKKFVQGFKAP